MGREVDRFARLEQALEAAQYGRPAVVDALERVRILLDVLRKQVLMEQAEPDLLPIGVSSSVTRGRLSRFLAFLDSLGGPEWVTVSGKVCKMGKGEEFKGVVSEELRIVESPIFGQRDRLGRFLLFETADHDTLRIVRVYDPPHGFSGHESESKRLPLSSIRFLRSSLTVGPR